MNGQIEDLLRRRADRADPQPDADRMLGQVRVLAEQQRRHRRSLAAAGSGVAVVAVVVTLILLVTPGGSGAPNGRQVGGRPADSTTAQAQPAPAPKTLPVSSPARTTAAPAGRLVKIGVTPKRAPLAVRLVPAGYHYLGAASDATIYGPPGTNRDPDVWVGKLALIVGQRYGHRAMPLTLAGHPGRVDREAAPFGWTATIELNKTVELTIQIPTKADLSRTQAIQLANSLKVRDTSNVAHG